VTLFSKHTVNILPRFFPEQSIGIGGLEPASVVSANFQKCHVSMVLGLSVFVFVVIDKELQSPVLIQIFYNFIYGSFEPISKGSDYKIGIAHPVFTFFGKSLMHNLNLGLAKYKDNVENYFREAA